MKTEPTVGYESGEKRRPWLRIIFVLSAIKTRLAGWIGHAGQANSKRLVERLSQDWTFARGEAESCSARRLMEQ